MSNPITGKDLVDKLEPIDEAIAKLVALGNEHEKQFKRIVSQAVKLEAATKDSNSATVAGRDAIKQQAAAASKLEKEYQKVITAQDENAVKLAALKNTQRQLNQVNKLEAKLLASKEGSYNRLAAQYGLNKIRLNQMSKAEREATKEGRELEKQSAEIYEEMKRLQEATGKHVLSVGDYAKGTRALLDQLDQMPGALGDMSQGVQGVGKQFRALLRNPIVLFLSLIVGAITILVGAFRRSEKGAELMAKGSAILQGILSTLTRIAVDFAEKIEFAFTNPQEALKNFGKLIVESVVNRLKALPLLVKAVGDSLVALWERDMEAMRKAGEDAFNAVVQSVTGLDAEQQKDFSDAVKETTKIINENTKAFVALENQKLKVRRANRALAKSIEDLTTVQDFQRGIADNTTKSFKEREEAAERARVATEKRANQEIQLARNNLSIINRELSIRRSNGELVEDLLDRQLDAYRSLRQAERDLTLAIQDNERTRAELKQDRLERDLDILIDGFDNQKTINEQRIKNDELTAQARRDILAETRQLSDDSFKKQIETIQQFTGIQIDSNSLIAESDAVVLNQKIRALGLSEIIEGRLLEIVRDRKSANQDLAASEIELANTIRNEILTAERERINILFVGADRQRAILDLEYQAKLQTTKNIVLLDKWYADQKEKIDDQELARRQANELKVFEQVQTFKRAEFEALKRTEEEKSRFRLEQERETIEEILELNKRLVEDGGTGLNVIQINTYLEELKRIDREIDEIGNRAPRNILEVFGIDVSPESLSALDFAKQQISEFFNSTIQLSQANVRQRNTEVAERQRALQAEIDARNAGYAHNVETAQKELADAKANQQKALEEQRKAQRAQIALNTAEQASNLITATTGLWRQLRLAAIPAIAIMWGSFIAAKAQAFKLTRTQRRKGGYDVLKGPSHQGGGIDTGINSKGQIVEAEGKEGQAIFSRKSVRRYGHKLLREVTHSINSGNFFEDWTRAKNATKMAGLQTINYSNSTDTSGIESRLDKIHKQGDRQTWTVGNATYVKEGNTTNIYYE